MLRSARPWRALVPVLVGVAAVIALVLAINPREFAAAARGFDVRLVPVVVVLSMSYYLLQGVRWHFLLRAVGVPLRVGDSVLLNLAGQAAGLLPFGELTRGVLVCEVFGAQLGAVVATITVQELIYTLIIIAAAVPGSLTHHAAADGVIAALVGALLVFVILTVPSVFRAVMVVVRHTPLLSRFTGDIVALQRDTVVMLRRWDTLWWSSLSALGALAAVTLFWLVVHALSPGLLSWNDAAFVYAVSHVVGAITFSPGGLGSFEASTIGMLLTVLPPGYGGLAVAAALLQRGADKGLATCVGMVAYVAARRRYHFRPLRVALTPRTEAQAGAQRAGST